MPNVPTACVGGHWLVSVLLALLPLSFIPAVRSASFDCAKASTRVEQLVCASQDLRRLDDRLTELYELAQDRDAVPNLRAAQRAWLARRNTCRDRACVAGHYEQRLAELSCDPNVGMLGSATGWGECAWFTLRGLDRELEAVGPRYGRKVAEDTDNPEYTYRTFLEEAKAWRSYRAAQCALEGAITGGTDGWKNANATQCEVDAATKRLADMKAAIGGK